MKIRRMQCFKVDLPFKRKFAISHSERETSESVFLKVTLNDNTVGWGEAVPRQYVTGETQDSVVRVLSSRYAPYCGALDPSSYEALYKWLRSFRPPKKERAAFCALDLALLDAYGKYFSQSVSDLLPSPAKSHVLYSGAVSLCDGFRLLKELVLMRLYGLKRIKVKVGAGDDARRVGLARKVFGNNVDIRVDANEAWDVETTLRKIEEFRQSGISGIEQPVPGKEDIRRLVRRTNLPVIVDESVCTLRDARDFSKVILDLRLSKCGGIAQTEKIYAFSEQNKERRELSCQLGCHVGESGVLSAAGRHFAFAMGNIEYLEGSYNRFLLKTDVTMEDTSFRRRGYAVAMKGCGLGVTVRENAVRRYSASGAIELPL